MSDFRDNRTHSEASQHLHSYGLAEASRHARWRTILAAARASRMDSVMVRSCIAFAMLMPDMSGDDVVAHVTKNTQTAPDSVEREDVVQLFARAS